MTITAFPGTGFSVPIVNIASTLAAGRPVGGVADQIDRACCDVGFFAIEAAHRRAGCRRDTRVVSQGIVSRSDRSHHS